MRNWKQEAAANAIGIKQHSYSRYEKGLREPNLRILSRICKVFGITNLLEFIDQEIKDDEIKDAA